MFHWGAEYHVRKGNKVRFWHDAWIGGIPLKIQFRYIFDICRSPNAKVRNFLVNGEWHIPLRRCLGGDSLPKWEELLALLDTIKFDVVGKDDVKWTTEKSQNFSTKSLYYCQTHGGVKDYLTELI